MRKPGQIYFPAPGGALHLDQAKYEQLPDDRTTRCSGARFVPTPRYQVKLEGVSFIGHQAIFIGGFQDPILIPQLDDFLESVQSYTQGLFPELDKSNDCRLLFHVYGRNAIMGPLEPNPTPAHEVGIMGEVVAPTEERAMSIANSARVLCLHLFYPGILATVGNFASPLSPHEQSAGPVFRFNVFHLMNIDDPVDPVLFPITSSTVGPNTFTPDTQYEKQFYNIDDFIGVETQVIEAPRAPSETTTMRRLASVVRSKNSGPFELTFDIMFSDAAVYERVKKADVLSADVIKKLYRLQNEDILVNMFFDPALAWKCTIKRPWEQGTVGETDTLGTAQHVPLLDVIVPGLDT